MKTKKKFKLIKYNKIIKNKLNISLINFKDLSGKYIIFDTNKKRKEYLIHNYSLIFEGEYINGKRNGKGKEYRINGELEFEGEYLNGKKMEKEKNIILAEN